MFCTCAQNCTVCWGRETGCYTKLGLTPLYGEFTEGEKLCTAILIFASTARQCSNRSTAHWHVFFWVQGLLRRCMGNDFRATCFVCNKAPITDGVMAENITTDTPGSTQCHGDRLTDWLAVCLKHQGTHKATQDTRHEDRLQSTDFCHIYLRRLLCALLVSKVGMHTICKTSFL